MIEMLGEIWGVSNKNLQEYRVYFQTFLNHWVLNITGMMVSVRGIIPNMVSHHFKAFQLNDNTPNMVSSTESSGFDWIQLRA